MATVKPAKDLLARDPILLRHCLVRIRSQIFKPTLLSLDMEGRRKYSNHVVAT